MGSEGCPKLGTISIDFPREVCSQCDGAMPSVLHRLTGTYRAQLKTAQQGRFSTGLQPAQKAKGTAGECLILC